MSQKVVVVESPAKAKTINKYLGSGYTVIASYGHIRDVPPKDGSVRPDEDFAMDWELGDRAARPVGEIVKAVKGAEAVFLATDPDREGEAIAWHIQEVLNEKKAAGKAPIRRVTFNEITRKAVQDALAHPRDIDYALVDAYRARRALDYLVGFSLSPVLWRKLRGAKSAGRVQSVALRLICERETEIERFVPREFWSIEGLFLTARGDKVPAMLTHLDGKKLDKFALANETIAMTALARLQDATWRVAQVEKKQTRRNPWPPFTTSTLQQEASRRLGLGATRTMRLAQQLYEGVDIGGDTVGLITYMRTDGVTLSAEAIQGARAMIERSFGKEYLPAEARQYKTAARNAQEAHEAIRPTDLARAPDAVARYLDGDQLRLYTLIWQRTMASQMASAVLDQVAVDIGSHNGVATFRATGSTIVFDGWLRLYRDQEDDDAPASANDEQASRRLPPMNEGDPMTRETLKPDQHFTQPPPRYSEASLVKRLEELGIGRPSTYASIMQVLQDRTYVKLEKKRFIPEDRGRIVSAFLENFFRHYVEYDFTADLEEKLDKISDGALPWKNVMRDFWTDFAAAIGATAELKGSDVIDALDDTLGHHFFPAKTDGSDPRQCPHCGTGRMGLKLGKFGAFLGCSNYPECKNTRPLAIADEGGEGSAATTFPPRPLGDDPVTGLPVSVRSGPYGAYAQLGPAPEPPASREPDVTPAADADGDDKPKKKGKAKPSKKKTAAPKPKRVSIPKGVDPTLVDLDTALRLLALPRDVGAHPESGEMILAGIGRFGPYLNMGKRYKNLTDGDDVLSVGLNRAVALLAEPDKGRGGRGAASALRTIGEHPDDAQPITLHSGRFGPYVKWGKIMATVPSADDPETLALQRAVEILTAKAEKLASGGGKAPKKKPAPRARKTAKNR